jgi:hypothetical protein
MTKPKLLYIAGPYRPRKGFQSLPVLRWFFIARNILRARRLAIWLWKNGDYAICPHLNTAFFDGHAPDSVWLEGDLVMMRRCDAVVMLQEWTDSTGARYEHLTAILEGLPIYYWTGHTLYRKESNF